MSNTPLFKVRQIPIIMTDLQYSRFLHYSRLAGGQHHLATHLFFTGMIASEYYRFLKQRKFDPPEIFDLNPYLRA